MTADPAFDEGVRALVTGASGFVGRRLVAALRKRFPGWSFDARGSSDTGGRGGGIDVTDAKAVSAWVAAAKPQVVIHLAAIAAVTATVKDPRQAWRVNLDGTLNLVLALQEQAPDAHLLFVSSAETYGFSLNSPNPVDELALLQPVNPYAASKAAADILVRQAAAAGLSATVVRPFNHTGPGQNELFVAPNFAGQIARIERGLQPPMLSVGNLDDERDFLNVDDVIQAYVLLLEMRNDPSVKGVFNIASGATVRIGDLLEQLLSLAKVRIEVKIDPNRFRPTPIPRIVGDASRLRALGWAPEYTLADTLAAVFEDRRRAVG